MTFNLHNSQQFLINIGFFKLSLPLGSVTLYFPSIILKYLCFALFFMAYIYFLINLLVLRLLNILKKKMLEVPELWRGETGESGDQGYSLLHSEFNASLSYMRLCVSILSQAKPNQANPIKIITTVIKMALITNKKFSN